MPVPALLTAAVIAVTPAVPAYEPEGCRDIRTSRKASEGLTRALKHTHEVDKRHVVDLWWCVATKPKAHRLHARAHRLWGWRHHEPRRSWIVYYRQPAFWRTWAERVVQCESGGNPNASNGTHFGRFQWLPSTWAAAGGTGSPTTTSYPYEATVAIRWAQRAGTGQWQCK